MDYVCIWSTGQEDRFLNQPGQEPIKSVLSHFNLQYCHIFVINFCLGDVLLSLNKLDLNSSNVHTILAAITGPMEVSNFFLCISWMRWLFNYLQISMLPNNFKVALNVCQRFGGLSAGQASVLCSWERRFTQDHSSPPPPRSINGYWQI